MYPEVRHTSQGTVIPSTGKLALNIKFRVKQPHL